MLDNKRLGKQRVENLQIMNALVNPNYGWQNHPAVRMWRGSEWWLAQYHHNIVNEWAKRGYADTTKDKVLQIVYNNLLGTLVPPWLGDERVHKTHRSNLLRKDPAHYSQFGWTEPNNLLYYWPV